MSKAGIAGLMMLFGYSIMAVAAIVLWGWRQSKDEFFASR